MYTDLEDNLTKCYYKKILNEAILRSEEDLNDSPHNSQNISFHNQLLDIKQCVIIDKVVYTQDQAYNKYPLAVMVSRNFLGDEGESDYAKMLKDIVWGISLYPNMPERI